jgi:hypothetical protein
LKFVHLSFKLCWLFFVALPGLQAEFPDGAKMTKQARACMSALSPPLSIALHQLHSIANYSGLLSIANVVRKEHVEAAEVERAFWHLVQVFSSNLRTEI